ncbi:HI0074 family nucleotidyltransferase substrate-binding subunit [Salinarimonas ramus]|nr:HI0074 family nucleotidyltransferase substrate-binding subunit [Salinarimonas ramus]
MSDTKPDITLLSRALERLIEGWARYEADTSDIQIRDGLVQRFEFTYEIAHKSLKRYLEYASPNPETVDAMTFSELIRTASEQGLLLGEWPEWRTFREMRGKTSHAYSERVALEVVAGIPRFIDEARVLRDRLAGRLA